MLNNEIIFYAGMPRSGSHLLSGILNQNPLIHSEGSSALCRILWDTNRCIKGDVAQDELKYFDRNTLEFQKQISHSIINVYYKDIKSEVILDKNRSWTTKENIDLIKSTIIKDPKFIVMTRNTKEVVMSFVNVYMLNGFSQYEAEKNILNFDEVGRNPFMRPAAATAWAKFIKNDEEFLFIDYDDLVNDTNKTIDSLYKFINKPSFTHDLNNITMKYKENAGLMGLVNVRKTILKNKNELVLSETAKEKIQYIDHIFDLCNNPQENIIEIENFYYSNCG